MTLDNLRIALGTSSQPWEDFERSCEFIITYPSYPCWRLATVYSVTAAATSEIRPGPSCPDPSDSNSGNYHSDLQPPAKCESGHRDRSRPWCGSTSRSEVRCGTACRERARLESRRGKLPLECADSIPARCREEEHGNWSTWLFR